MSNRIYVRGDTHGSYDWLEKFCQDEQTDHSDILILLGDHALRFEGYNNRREVHRKEQVSKFPITIFGVFGNHDRPPRPDLQETQFSEFEETNNNETDTLVSWLGGIKY